MLCQLELPFQLSSKEWSSTDRNLLRLLSSKAVPLVDMERPGLQLQLQLQLSIWVILNPFPQLYKMRKYLFLRIIRLQKI